MHPCYFFYIIFINSFISDSYNLYLKSAAWFNGGMCCRLRTGISRYVWSYKYKDNVLSKPRRQGLTNQYCSWIFCGRECCDPFPEGGQLWPYCRLCGVMRQEDVQPRYLIPSRVLQEIVY